MYCIVTEHDRYEVRERPHLVEFLVKLIELGGLSHLVLVHHEGWLDLLVSVFPKEIKAVSNERLVEIDAVVGQKVTAMASNFGTLAKTK